MEGNGLKNNNKRGKRVGWRRQSGGNGVGGGLGDRKLWERRAGREKQIGRRKRSFSVLIFCSLELDSLPGTPLCKF